MQIGTFFVESWMALVIFFSVFVGVGILIFRGGLSLNFKKFGISIKGKNKIGEMFILLNELDELKEEVLSTKYYEITSQQMKFAENQLNFISDMQQDVFVELYTEKNKNKKPQANRDFLYYSLILEKVKSHTLNILRKSFIKNGLVNMNKEDFFDYKQNSVMTVIFEMRQIMEKWYNTVDNIIESSELFKKLDSKDKDIENFLYKTFDHAKEIADKKIAEIEELKKRREEIVKQKIEKWNS